MSVTQKDKIDFIGISKESGEVILSISDHLDWEDELFHVTELQDKINAYLSFVESGEIYESYPKAINKSIVIQLISQYPLSPMGLEFMKKVKGVLYDLDIKLLF